MIHARKSNWYWGQQLQYTIIVTTCKNLHPCLDVVGITDVQETPKSVCNIIQAKKDIQRHHICLIDADYDYILD